jgi:hypothetical protein
MVLKTSLGGYRFVFNILPGGGALMGDCLSRFGTLPQSATIYRVTARPGYTRMCQVVALYYWVIARPGCALACHLAALYWVAGCSGPLGSALLGGRSLRLTWWRSIGWQVAQVHLSALYWVAGRSGPLVVPHGSALLAVPRVKWP